MKHKFKVVGALAYFGLFVFSAVAFIFDSCLAPSPVPLGYALLILCALIMSAAFWLRYTDRASVFEMTSSVIFSYGVSALLLSGNLDSPGYLILAAVWAIIWLIAETGIGIAVIVAKKWNTPRARRLVRWVVPSTVLLVAAGCYLHGVVRYLISSVAAGRFSPSALVCNADELHSTRVIPELEVPITPGTNLIWCAPFQLAWNDMMELIGEELHFAGDEPDIVA
ncbi:MAG: hypothetical protein JXR23_07745 [Pontiellaceae bacterium]|nr:hypothetical protein [Pontiellaceae bacterium]